MRILYYDWDEFNGEDCRDAMIRLGHEVETICIDLSSLDLTPEIEEQFRIRFNRNPIDLVYSFDYFPNISEICQKYNVPYISWVFDCPHYPLFSPTINNPVNRIFVFDRTLGEKLKDNGATTVHHLPLGVNEKRLSDLCSELDRETGGSIIYQHDVCFLGSLYDNEFNFYDQVTDIPEELRDYTEQVIEAQQKVFGVDFFSDERVFSDSDAKLLLDYINIENTGKYKINYPDIVRDILRKKVTVNERRKILEEMGKRFDTVIYTNPNANSIPRVRNMGVASYVEKMPVIFHRSKININISLRCITSGISLRVMDVLAAGGFLVTTATKEIEECFVDGKDLAIAHTPEEMIEKTAYYLEHEEERKEIARNGQKKVFEKFSYTKLLPTILNQF